MYGFTVALPLSDVAASWVVFSFFASMIISVVFQIGHAQVNTGPFRPRCWLRLSAGLRFFVFCVRPQLSDAVGQQDDGQGQERAAYKNIHLNSAPPLPNWRLCPVKKDHPEQSP